MFRAKLKRLFLSFSVNNPFFRACKNRYPNKFKCRENVRRLAICKLKPLPFTNDLTSKLTLCFLHFFNYLTKVRELRASILFGLPVFACFDFAFDLQPDLHILCADDFEILHLRAISLYDFPDSVFKYIASAFCSADISP